MSRATVLPNAAAPKSALGRYRLLSPTAGIRVSPLCLGAMNFGDAWYVSHCLSPLIWLILCFPLFLVYFMPGIEATSGLTHRPGKRTWVNATRRPPRASWISSSSRVVRRDISRTERPAKLFLPLASKQTSAYIHARLQVFKPVANALLLFLTTIGNFIDTANNYQNEVSQKALGKEPQTNTGL